jgi:hypothetical protein
MHDYGQQSHLVFGFELDPVSFAEGVVRWQELLESGFVAPRIDQLKALSAHRVLSDNIDLQSLPEELKLYVVNMRRSTFVRSPMFTERGDVPAVESISVYEDTLAGVCSFLRFTATNCYKSRAHYLLRPSGFLRISFVEMTCHFFSASHSNHARFLYGPLPFFSILTSISTPLFLAAVSERQHICARVPQRVRGQR